MIRPEVFALIRRAQELVWAAGVVGIGGWLIWLGGYLLVPVGGGVMALGAAFGIMAWRRMRFAQDTLAPGVVEVDEGQIGYLGPTIGGYVSLPELAEVRLITMRGRRLWRLKQNDGQTILIPVDAAGAERLFDAFASLPGMDSAALVAALGPSDRGPSESDTKPARDAAQSLPAPTTADPQMRLIWRRRGAGVAVRS